MLSSRAEAVYGHKFFRHFGPCWGNGGHETGSLWGDVLDVFIDVIF
jgi:hypothetical protein